MEDETMPQDMAQPQEQESKIDMESMMGNFMDLPQEQRKMVVKIMQTPLMNVVDQVIGEPVFARLRDQLNEPIPGKREGAPVAMEEPTTEQPSGMMAPQESTVSLSNGGVLGTEYGETSPENKKLIQLYKEGKLSLQGMQEFARDINSRRLSEDESNTPSKEEMEVFYDMAYEYGEEELLPEKYSEK